MPLFDGNPPVVAISGPTAAGKTALALQLCDELSGGNGPWQGAEIVSVDSAQIYRGMNIGTAKPDAATQAHVRHHLLDILDPAEAYSAARFATDARLAIAGIRSRGRVPVLVGGTLLYFRALLEGLSELPPADPAFRARLQVEAEQLGWAALHARLAKADPEAAARLHPNDAQRIQRALEIAEFSGAAPDRKPLRQSSVELAAPILRLAVSPPQREQLNVRIELRFRQMISEGFVEEVRNLRERGDLHLGLPSMRAVGYRQLWGYLDGEYPLERAVQFGIIATRHYAKRQMTWLRGEAGKWNWLDPAEPNSVALVFKLVTKSSK